MTHDQHVGAHSYRVIEPMIPCACIHDDEPCPNQGTEPCEHCEALVCVDCLHGVTL